MPLDRGCYKSNIIWNWQSNVSVTPSDNECCKNDTIWKWLVSEFSHSTLPYC